ncbi:hypothetical protein STEG23_024597, partial [Scotinomys teguina]
MDPESQFTESRGTEASFCLMSLEPCDSDCPSHSVMVVIHHQLDRIQSCLGDKPPVPMISSVFLCGPLDFPDTFSGMLTGGLQKDAKLFTWASVDPTLFGNAFVSDVAQS